MNASNEIAKTTQAHSSAGTPRSYSSTPPAGPRYVRTKSHIRSCLALWLSHEEQPSRSKDTAPVLLPRLCMGCNSTGGLVLERPTTANLPTYTSRSPKLRAGASPRPLALRYYSAQHRSCPHTRHGLVPINSAHYIPYYMHLLHTYPHAN